MLFVIFCLFVSFICMSYVKIQIRLEREEKNRLEEITWLEKKSWLEDLDKPWEHPFIYWAN
jgi:hypothetical protein